MLPFQAALLLLCQSVANESTQPDMLVPAISLQNTTTYIEDGGREADVITFNPS